MFKEIKIGDKAVPMLAKASCNIYYKSVFGEDPIRITAQAAKDGLEDEAGVHFAWRMAYIFAMAAEAQGHREKMLNLNEDTYAEWLDQFDTGDLFAVMGDVMTLYNGERPDSKEKKAE